ncbi:MAG: hypothetical protein EXS40_10785 [Opitutaceae bacterium]|nr:hypothetical protein [Opitutaceae bacterium]
MKAPAQVALAPFAGILNSIKLPGEISLGRLDVEAKVQLPGNQSATLTLSGGGLKPGKFVTITWKVAFSDVGKGALLTAAQASGEIKLRTSAALRVDAVEIFVDASVTGPSLPSDRVKVEVKLAQVDAKSGEPFATSPLALNLQLAAKGQLANGRNQARQLEGKTDAKGHYLMATPFALASTVEKPDSSDFWKNLTLNTASGFLR